MNLHGIVSGAIGAVNPHVPVQVQVSTGSTVGADFAPVPSYAPPVTVMAQVQAMTFGDVQHADALNIQGIRRAIYLNGEIDGLIRSKNKGGDLIQLPDGSIWLVAEVLEHWPDWTKCIIVLQDDVALPASSGLIAKPGVSFGLGYVQFVPPAGAPGVLFQAGQRAALAMAVNPSQTVNTLAGPFANWSFWDGANLAARAIGDAYAIRLTIDAVSAVGGGSILADATVNGSSVPIETDQFDLATAAGTPQILTFNLALYPKASFVAAGAQIYLTPTVPVVLTNTKLIIQPTCAG